MQVRRQLPARSPLPPRAILGALRNARGDAAQERLRELLVREFRAERVTLFGSGTQALTAAIRAALVHVGGTRPLVTIPGYSCYDIATAALGASADVALYDIDPETLQPDWASLERAFAAGARVAVLAYLYGVPIDWERAEELARPYGAMLIEDAAQGAGGSWKGRPLGSLGAISVVSFGRGKGWTGGAGGALLGRGTPLPEITPEAPAPGSAALLAGTAAQALIGRPAWYGLPYSIPWLHLGETVFHPPGPLRELPPFAAALLLETAEASRAEAPIRRRNAEAWRTQLTAPAAADRLRPLPSTIPEDAEPGYLRLPVLLGKDCADRVNVPALGRWGIERGYPTTPEHIPELRPRIAVDATQPLPGGRILAGRLLTFPTHGWTTARDLASAGTLLNAARI